VNGKLEDVALWRHHEAAVEAAAALLAFSRCQVTDREPAYALTLRQRLQAIDLLHTFGYNARRAIELADTHEPGTIKHAKAIVVHPRDPRKLDLAIDEDAKELTDESLWWVLGRIIHSQELTIHYRDEARVGTEWAAAPNLTIYRTPIAFAVRSDFDGPLDCHYVVFDDLLTSFAGLRERVAAACMLIGFPIESQSPFL
jgi:hypothetical protein